MWYCAMLLSVGVVFFCAHRWGEKLESLWAAGALAVHRVQARSWVPIALAGFLAIGACIGHALIFGIPSPQVQDEFSYLLAADTFSHGTLTNPSHPMWVHFETIHEIWKPTYASKYPPGQGLFLAVGQILTGQPIIGVWLSMGLASAAIAWMFQAVVARTYATVGGFLIALHPIMTNWGDRYWGGGVALFGGALALGAFLRLRYAARTRYALAFATGLAVLAVTRPFEGLALAIPLFANLIWRAARGATELSRTSKTVWVPMLACLTLVGSWIGYYNLKVTGNILEMPYAEEVKEYEKAPILLFLPPLPDRVYHHVELERFWAGLEYDQYKAEQSLSGFVASVGEKLHIIFGTATGFQPLWVLSLVALPFAVAKRRQIRLLATILSFWLFVVIWETYFHNHYAAPALPLIFALFVIGLEQLCRTSWRDRPFGRSLAGISILVFVASIPAFHFADASGKLKWAARRAEIKRTLQNLPGKQLVIVHYSPDHEPGEEWIYNAPNIDQSNVVWAQDMGPKNIELLDYFCDRTAWILNADDTDPTLTVERHMEGCRRGRG